MSVAHYENFPVASILVPRSLRPAIVAIYRFARAADDLADEGDAAPAERLAALRRFERAIDGIGERLVADEPPFPELAAAIDRHRLPLAPFRDLLSAFRQDVVTTRYADYATLRDYCRRSADPVGRLLLHLYGRSAPQEFAWSDAICSALQLANFWQDVASDWRRGRVYIPAEDLAHFGVTEETIAAGDAGGRWPELMAFEVLRTRRLLESGRPLTRVLPWRLGVELGGVLAGGHRVLDAIDAARGDVFGRPLRIGGFGWLAVARDAFFPRRRHIQAVRA